MGQIIGGAAKPKRCNLNKLSQLGIPAAGEYILVSSDNSMNAAGQGNFDCYIEGDGTMAATALPLHKFKGEELEEKLYGKENLLMDNVTTQPSTVYITADMVTAGEVLVFQLESINNLQGTLKAEKEGYVHDGYITVAAGQSAMVEYTVPENFLRIYTQSTANPVLVTAVVSSAGDIDKINDDIDKINDDIDALRPYLNTYDVFTFSSTGWQVQNYSFSEGKSYIIKNISDYTISNLNIRNGDTNIAIFTNIGSGKSIFVTLSSNCDSIRLACNTLPSGKTYSIAVYDEDEIDAKLYADIVTLSSLSTEFGGDINAIKQSMMYQNIVLYAPSNTGWNDIAYSLPAGTTVKIKNIGTTTINYIGITYTGGSQGWNNVAPETEYTFTLPADAIKVRGYCTSPNLDDRFIVVPQLSQLIIDQSATANSDNAARSGDLYNVKREIFNLPNLIQNNSTHFSVKSVKTNADFNEFSELTLGYINSAEGRLQFILWTDKDDVDNRGWFPYDQNLSEGEIVSGTKRFVLSEKSGHHPKWVIEITLYFDGTVFNTGHIDSLIDLNLVTRYSDVLTKDFYPVTGSALYDTFNGFCDYESRDTTKNFITVSKDGTGDYTTIADACAAITDGGAINQYEIIVYPGVYDEIGITMPKYVHIHGLIPETVVLTTKSNKGLSTLPFFDYIDTCKISNLTMDSWTGYCVHADHYAAGYVEFENVHFIKNIFEGSTEVLFGISGRTHGRKYSINNCVLECRGGNGVIGGHDVPNSTVNNTEYLFTGCTFIRCSVSYHSAGGLGISNMKFLNCVFDKSCKSIYLYNEPNRCTFENSNLYPAQRNTYYQFIASGCKHLCPAIPKVISTIKLDADYPITISGTAADIIFGANYTKNDVKTSRISCWLMSEFWIKDAQTGEQGVTDVIDVFQLWKRLGDCSVNNKVLNVTVNGVTKSYTFNQDYETLQTPENDIIADMQLALDNVTIVNYQTASTDYDMDAIKSTGKEYVELADSDILEYEFVNVLGHKATSLDTLHDIVGIACKDCVQGETVPIWTQNFPTNLSDGLYGLDEHGVLSQNASLKIGRVMNGVFNPSYHSQSN